MPPQNTDEWKVLYPLYFDKNVSRKDGRQIPKEIAIDSPTALEVELALRTLGYPCLYENKRHPATPFLPGRVRVHYEKRDSTEDQSGTGTTKIELLHQIAKTIPELKHRVDAQKQIKHQQQTDQKQTKAGNNRRRR